ncbi:helix-turn-helix domain-containing protein [Lentimicrobium sp. L6]|uniref:helix-turn-helix transcriptional regulator n=1 Tax=Lentimicrobium sp. L6 TaxID=2735916 RepID=UPI0015544167|nr:helix-turn-helix domain-containing protein [Lentimicrobium sp. L6]NPD86443.1 helix-turn-helix domain-containing protein [Lentimicrobium sp. L6]
MSSKIEVQKICEFCGEEFIAKTTVTRFCGHTCASRSYKQRKKENKVGRAIEETNKQKILSITELNQEVIKQKDFLSIKEAHTLLGLSERTFYRLMKAGTIQATKLGKRTIIKRSEIDKLFAS